MAARSSLSVQHADALTSLWLCYVLALVCILVCWLLQAGGTADLDFCMFQVGSFCRDGKRVL